MNSGLLAPVLLCSFQDNCKVDSMPLKHNIVVTTAAVAWGIYAILCFQIGNYAKTHTVL